MTLTDIKNGIIRILRENTGVEDITGEDVSRTEGEALLHVQLVPLFFRTAAAGDRKSVV